MYVVDLPRSLEGNLAFELVKRHLRLDQTAQGATGKLSLQQVDDLITWMRRVIEAVDPRWAERTMSSVCVSVLLVMISLGARYGVSEGKN